jgi:hypothetical protein
MTKTRGARSIDQQEELHYSQSQIHMSRLEKD